jgi:hypothetical protein
MPILRATTVFIVLMLGGPVWSQEQPSEALRGCTAWVDLEYYQKNTHVYVKSTLTNEQCAASSGSYVIRIRYLPDEGEPDEIEFKETWSRDDDADIVTEKEYYVGENLEVRRVRSSKLKCVCAVENTEETSR